MSFRTAQASTPQETTAFALAFWPIHLYSKDISMLTGEATHLILFQRLLSMGNDSLPFNSQWTKSLETPFQNHCTLCKTIMYSIRQNPPTLLFLARALLPLRHKFHWQCLILELTSVTFMTVFVSFYTYRTFGNTFIRWLNNMSLFFCHYLQCIPEFCYRVPGIRDKHYHGYINGYMICSFSTYWTNNKLFSMVALAC